MLASLSEEEAVGICNSFDVVGDIAIMRSRSVSKVKNIKVAEAIMERHKNVKTVLIQEKGICGDFRLRSLAHLAGERRSLTIHRESGSLFKVDLESCYFSPRLMGERLRIANQVQEREVIINMFAGVGCFSIIIARKVPSAKIYSIDINPVAVKYLTENVRMNMVYGRVIPLLGDSKEVVQSRLRASADRVLLLLPERAFDFLPIAVSALKPSGGWIHYYDFEHARKNENPAEKCKFKVAGKLEKMGVYFGFESSRVVRTVGPNWHQLVLDIHIGRIPQNLNN